MRRAALILGGLALALAGCDDEPMNDTGPGNDAGPGMDGGPGTDAGPGPGTAVELGTAGDFAILAKSGISTVPTSAVTGDVGVSPAAASYITGFSLTLDSSNEFATSTRSLAGYTRPTTRHRRRPT